MGATSSTQLQSQSQPQSQSQFRFVDFINNYPEFPDVVLSDNLKVTLGPRNSIVSEAGALLYAKGDPFNLTPTREGATSSLATIMSGDTLFRNVYTTQGRVELYFGNACPGTITEITIPPNESFLIAKHCFVASTINIIHGVSGNVSQSFLGQGFMLPVVQNPTNVAAKVWIECFGGTSTKHTVNKGETLRIDNELFLACNMKTPYSVGLMATGFMNSFLSGEGFGMIFTNNSDEPYDVYTHARSVRQFSEVVKKYIGTERHETRNLGADIGIGFLNAALNNNNNDGGSGSGSGSGGGKKKSTRKKRIQQMQH